MKGFDTDLRFMVCKCKKQVSNINSALLVSPQGLSLVSLIAEMIIITDISFLSAVLRDPAKNYAYPGSLRAHASASKVMSINHNTIILRH